LQFITHT